MINRQLLPLGGCGPEADRPPRRRKHRRCSAHDVLQTNVVGRNQLITRVVEQLAQRWVVILGVVGAGKAMPQGSGAQDAQRRWIFKIRRSD